MPSASDMAPICLVTGGAGFFGRVLTRRLLDEGYRVRVLDLATHPQLDPRAELVRGDLREMALVSRAVEGVDIVFHTAALINLCGVASRHVRRTVHDVNVGGTRNVIAACVQHGVGRLVYTSTNNVILEPQSAMRRGDEREPYATRPIDLYTHTKIAAERLVLTAGKGGTLRTCALRPGGIWGPMAGGVMLEKVLDQLAQGTLVARIGRGAEADNTHVDNLAHAQLLAARALEDKPELVSGEAYFITDDEPMDPLEWFRPLVEALGHELPTHALPGWLMYGASYGMEWVHRLGGPKPLLTRVEVLKVTQTHSVRIDKARAHLGYVPRVKSRDGLLECVPLAREHLANKRAPRGR